MYENTLHYIPERHQWDTQASHLRLQFVVFIRGYVKIFPMTSMPVPPINISDEVSNP